VRIIQRCPEWLPTQFEPWIRNPEKTLILQHERGIRPSAALAKVYKNQREHDPADIHRAREVASSGDPIPVGILYRNPEVPCYEELRHAGQLRSTKMIKTGLEREFDKFTVWPQEAENVRPGA
jgi:2-oxoglutarate ferredoxin oxidoreductase subunit beta